MSIPPERYSTVRKFFVSACFVGWSLIDERRYYSTVIAKPGLEVDDPQTSATSHLEFVDDDTVRRRLRNSRTGFYNTTYPHLAHFFNHIPKTAGYYVRSQMYSVT